MPWKQGRGVLAAGFLVLAPGVAAAATRDVANVPTFTLSSGRPVVNQLSFGRSVLNQLSFDTYRTPFDELQSRPYNMLFANISRQPNFGPWPGQQGSYARYVDGLIGNNGAADVDNDADAIQGTMIRRETGSLAWGISPAFLAGTVASDDTSGGSTFADDNELTAFDVRGAVAYQLSNSFVLGGGLRAVLATHDATDSSFEPGVGGFNGEDTFKQTTFAVDAGVRQFLTPISSWELSAVAGSGTSEQDVFSEDIDGTGAVTARFVSTNYDIDDLGVTLSGSYNRLRAEGLGEMEFGGGFRYARRELGNSDLAYTETGGVITPDVTLLSQDPVTTMGLFGTARSIFQAGETEVFLGARLGYDTLDGRQQTDAAGTIVNERIDDSLMGLALTLGVRQPVFRDKLRIIVSGRGDFLAAKSGTFFDAGSEADDTTVTVAQYAIGLETVLTNVTIDFVWLAGEEVTVNPVPIGIPAGSRQTVQLDRLVLFGGGVVVSLRLLTVAAILVSAAACSGSDTVLGPGPAPSAPTLLVVQSQIFTPRCAIPGCHVGADAPLGLNLSSVADSAANLISVPSGEIPAMMRVLPGGSANSYLYWKITGNPAIGGDPMPLSGGPLSPGDIDLVASWIDGGAN